ncbi:hypothetical protein [Gynurincola endophyticus]|uniref:hypothetical protein n=1 Tax=Gynurincola endophyticus TaxID=2479004 RepID=UPI000F8F5D26|nr:hypothetical protein [Gynurincola endophyticus]
MILINSSSLKEIEQAYEKAENLLHEKEYSRSVVTKDIKELVKQIIDTKWVLIEEIEKDFSLFDIQSAKDTIVGLFPLVISYEHLRDRLKVHPVIKIKIRFLLNELQLVTGELKALMSDLERYKVSDCSDLINQLYE